MTESAGTIDPPRPARTVDAGSRGWEACKGSATKALSISRRLNDLSFTQSRGLLPLLCWTLGVLRRARPNQTSRDLQGFPLQKTLLPKLPKRQVHILSALMGIVNDNALLPESLHSNIVPWFI